MENQFLEQKSGKDRRQFWRNHLNSWGSSGLSQAEYCRRNDLKIARFTYWKCKLNRENLPMEFVQIPAEPVEPTLFFQDKAAPSLRLTMGSRFAIEIPDGFSPTTLEQVLLILERV